MAASPFFYSIGIAEGGETIVAFVGMCILPWAFPMIATVFAVLCVLTVFQRTYWRRKVFDNHRFPCRPASSPRLNATLAIAWAVMAKLPLQQKFEWTKEPRPNLRFTEDGWGMRWRP